MMSPTEFIVVHSTDPILHIELHRPDQRNALTPELMRSVTSVLEPVRTLDAVRVVVLSAGGPAFCAGMDLKSVDLFDAAQADDFSVQLARLYRTLMTLPVPVLCAVQGPVLGGGVGIAMAGDIVITSADSTFSFSETRLGLVPALVSVPARRRLSPALMRRLALSAETIPADQAALFGMVDFVTLEDPLAATLARAERIVHEQSLTALRATKAFLLSTENARLELELESARLEFTQSVSTTAARLGLESFRRREKLDWLGAGE